LGQYNPGQQADHQITIRQNGSLRNADSLPVASVYADGVYNMAATVQSVGTGMYTVKYIVPQLAEGTDLIVEVTATTGGYTSSISFQDQIQTAAANVSSDIADEIIARGVSDVIASQGTIDRHSLGSMVLMMSSAASGSDGNGGGQIQVKHPDTDVVIHTYQINVGPGCPVQEIS